jgi:hypothetical protein
MRYKWPPPCLWGALFVWLNVALSSPITWARTPALNHESSAWRQNRTIPLGQQVFEVGSSYRLLDQRFGSGGSRQPLGANRSRSVTWGELIQAETSESGRQNLRDRMKSRGLSDDEPAAWAEYQVQREEFALALDWTYGLMRSWTVGVQIPLAYRRTRIATQVEMSSQLNTSKSRVRTMVDNQISDQGYSLPTESEGEWGVGDVRLMSRWRLLNTGSWSWLFDQEVRLPTSQSIESDRYLLWEEDGGQMDAGLSSTLEQRWRRVSLAGRLGWLAQLPDKVRGPKREEMTRDLGDWSWASLESSLRLSHRLAASVEYAFFMKQKDQWSGPSQAASRVADDSLAQELQTLRVGVEYRLGDRSGREGVSHMWVASAGYVQTLAGLNSEDTSRAQLGLARYY